MLSVAEAQARVLALAPVLAQEDAPLAECAGRYAAADIIARRTQPPFDASAMDGYAVRFADLRGPSTKLTLIGQSQAGERFAGRVESGQAVRIFTGAPVPVGADTVVVQEDVTAEGASIRLSGEGPGREGAHIRRRGLDFAEGAPVLRAGQRLGPVHIALAAAAGHGTIATRAKPRVILLSTGDELVEPGQATGPDQIVNSNGVMLETLMTAAGASVVRRQTVPDQLERLVDALDQATAMADCVVTIGGASVGDRDYVRPALDKLGAPLDFWKVAMKPGKPLMAGRLERADRTVTLVGLPGNPVSAYVSAWLFLLPCLRAAAGSLAPLPMPRLGILATDCAENGPRADFLRARANAVAGAWSVQPLGGQDSSMLSALAAANALALRPPHAPAARAGEPVGFIMLDEEA